MRDTIEHDGARFRVTVEPDVNQSPPWKEEDGHGPVSEWRAGRHGDRPHKAPGERVLFRGHGAILAYDYAEACRIARRDGWGYLPGPMRTRLTNLGASFPKIGPVWEATSGTFTGFGPNINAAIRDLYARHRASHTARSYAAAAADADYWRLRRWCEGEWYYVGVIVEILDDAGDPIGESESLWGIESDADEYIVEVAHALAGEILHRLDHAAGRLATSAM